MKPAAKIAVQDAIEKASGILNTPKGGCPAVQVTAPGSTRFEVYAVFVGNTSLTARKNHTRIMYYVNHDRVPFSRFESAINAAYPEGE